MFIDNDNNIIPNNLVTFVHRCIVCAAATEFIPVRASAQCVATMFIDNNIIPNNLVTFVQRCIVCAAANSSLFA